MFILSHQEAVLRPGEHGYVLECHRDYVLELHDDAWDERLDSLPKGIRRRLRPGLWTLNFGSFAGDTNLLGVPCKIVSRKLDADAFEAMLRDVVAASMQLPFAFQTPTGVAFEADHQTPLPVLYHRWLLLRGWIRGWGVSPREEDLAVILRAPNQRMRRDVFEVDVSLADLVSPGTLLDAVTSGDWVELRPDSTLATTGLARQVFHQSSKRLFPNRVRVDRPVCTMDTPENRFVKATLREARSLNRTFELRVAAQRDCFNAELVLETKAIEACLTRLLHDPFFVDIGEMTLVPTHSLVLQRQEGYRQLLQGQRRLQGAIRFPMSPEGIQAMIEVKNLATLYEIWCYFQVVQALSALLGEPEETIVVTHDDTKANLSQETRVAWVSAGVVAGYNRRFKGGRLGESYSVNLRPDVTVEVASRRLVLDAKFKLDGLGWHDEGSEVHHEDLYKMHTYREAIANVEAAYVLYPGVEEPFFLEGDRPGFGIGAISLRPGETDSRDTLLRCLSDFLQGVAEPTTTTPFGTKERIIE